MMYKACSRCGRIHSHNKKCYIGMTRRRKDTTANKIRHTSEWTNKAIEIKEDSKYLCSVCMDNKIYNYNNLEVHHIVPLEEDSTKAFDNYNLICLCRGHHREAECGEIEREYLFQLAKDREEGK